MFAADLTKQPAVAEAAAPPGAEAWGPGRRLALRFLFVYAAFCFTFGPLSPLFEVPPFDAVNKAYEAAWHALVPWAGKHVFGLTGDVVAAQNGSGDSTYNYAALLCELSLAALAGGAWSALDRRRANSERLYGGLRVYVRYSLAAVMLVYGMAKVFKTQFPSPSLDHLSRTYGESSPMGLLWTFMGYSAPYNVFTGGGEVLGGALLFFRRTTTLGALVVAAIMSNVVMLNFCYDVPVKIYSSNLLLMAAFLLAHDARRLVDAVVLGRATGASPPRKPSTLRWVERARPPLKALLVALTFWASISASLKAQKTRGPSAPKNELYGVYQVESFERAGEAPQAAAPWVTATFGRASFVVRRADGAGRSLRVKIDPEKHRIGLNPVPGGFKAPGEGPVDLAYERQGPERLRLEGEFEGERVVALLKKVPEPPSLLLGRGFHWVNEAPYNR